MNNKQTRPKTTLESKDNNAAYVLHVSKGSNGFSWVTAEFQDDPYMFALIKIPSQWQVREGEQLLLKMQQVPIVGQKRRKKTLVAYRANMTLLSYNVALCSDQEL